MIDSFNQHFLLCGDWDADGFGAGGLFRLGHLSYPFPLPPLPLLSLEGPATGPPALCPCLRIGSGVITIFFPLLVFIGGVMEISNNL